MESYLEILRSGEKPRFPSKKAVRTYDDMLKARLVIALEGLLRCYPKRNDAINVLQSLLRAAEIRVGVTKQNQTVAAGNVLAWRRAAKEKGRSGGLRYCFVTLLPGYDAEHEKCVDPRDGLRFAEALIEMVRCRQPTDYPEPETDRDGRARPRGAFFTNKKAKSTTQRNSVTTWSSVTGASEAPRIRLEVCSG